MAGLERIGGVQDLEEMAVIGGVIRTRRLLMCVVLAGTGSLFAQSAASGASNLSSVVLSQSFHNFVAYPPGARNGPINESNLNLVTGGNNSSAETEFAQLLASGNVTGYIRSWVHQPANGDAVVISALQFQDSTQAAAFVNGENGSAPSGVSSFEIPNVRGATGYVVHTSASGTPITEYLVVFGKGTTDFQMAVATESGDLTSADASVLASQQWANVPTQTNWTPIIRLTVSIGSILLSVIIVLIARRRRYSALFTTRPPIPGGADLSGLLVASEGLQS